MTIRRSDSDDCSARSLDSFCFDAFLPVKLPLASDATLKHYRSAIKQLGLLLGRTPTLDDLTDKNLSDLIRKLRNDGKSVITINRGPLCRLLTLWRFAARQKAVDRWPEIGSLDEPQTVPDAWRLHDVEQLIAACNKMPGRVGTHEAAPGFCALIGDRLH